VKRAIVVITLSAAALAAAIIGCTGDPYGEASTTVKGPTDPAPGASANPGRKDDGEGVLDAGGPSTPKVETKPPAPTDAVDGGVGDKPKPPDAGMGPCPNPDGKMIDFLWREPPPKPAQAPCSAADLGYVEGLITAKDSTYVGIETSMRARNVACANCLFSIQDDATWGSFVYYTADKSKGAFSNNGACYARVSGKKECGDEVQQYFYCLEEVCSFCGTDAERATCETTAKNDAAKCGRFQFNSCPQSLTELNDTCFSTWEKALGAVCGG